MRLGVAGPVSGDPIWVPSVKRSEFSCPPPRRLRRRLLLPSLFSRVPRCEQAGGAPRRPPKSLQAVPLHVAPQRRAAFFIEVASGTRDRLWIQMVEAIRDEFVPHLELRSVLGILVSITLTQAAQGFGISGIHGTVERA